MSLIGSLSHVMYPKVLVVLYRIVFRTLYGLVFVCLYCLVDKPLVFSHML